MIFTSFSPPLQNLAKMCNSGRKLDVSECVKTSSQTLWKWPGWRWSRLQDSNHCFKCSGAAETHVSLFKQLPSCLTLPSTCFNNTVCFPFLILCDYMMQSKKVYMTNKHTLSGMFRMYCLFLTCNADFFCDMINILSHYSVHLLSWYHFITFL